MKFYGFVVGVFIPFLSISLVYAEEPDLLFSDTLVEVLTPTRLKQHISDVPASVTVIRHTTLKKLGIRSIPEALRLVPGMIVGQAAGNDYRISYHGTNGLIPRRMQVLIDGISVYRTGYAQVGWKELPVSIDDVDKIEVTRSPSAATYGANSFFGVVNIITKHPNDTQGLRANLLLGSLSTRDAMATYGGSVRDTTFRITMGFQQDSGFDKNGFEEERRDSTKLQRLNFRSLTDINNNNLEVQFSAVRGELLNQYVSPDQVTFPDYEFSDSFFQSTWSQYINQNHQIKVKGYISQYDRDRQWQSCLPIWFFSDELRQLQAVNPTYAAAIVNDPLTLPTGGSAQNDILAQAVLDKINILGVSTITCGNANENIKEQQYDLEFQDTYIFSPSLRIVSGLGIRRDRANSETFLNGEININSSRLFANLEYSLTDSVTINLGGMWENEETHTDGYQFSPRGAINYHFNNNHTLRFVLSKAIRTPDMLEYDRDWSYTMRNMTPSFDNQTDRQYYYRAQADGNLSPEEIVAKEISYYLTFPQYNFYLDLKLFEEKLSKLISEKLQFSEYNPTNDNSARLRGSELELNYKHNAVVQSGVTYAYMDNDSTNFYEKSLYARHSGSFQTSLNLNDKWTTSLAYYGANSISGFSYNRVDFVVLNRSIFANKYKLGTQFIIRHFGGDSGFVVNENKSVINKYDNNTHYFVNVDFSM